jgi:uncharacterized protein (DUF1015 family)
MSDLPGGDPLVAPFLGEHYATLDRLVELLAPPYDVIAEPERAALARRHPNNIVHLILPEGNGDRYHAAAQRLERWRRDGVLVTEPSPAVYVVQQEFTVDGRGRVRTGLIAAVAAEPFEAGRIKPHERTHAGPKQDRLALLRSTRTMFEALLMLSRDPGGELAERLAQATEVAAPWATGSVRDVAVRAWRVAGPRAAELAAAAGRGALYIADGHHRFETAAAFRREVPAAARTLALVVPVRDPGLVVSPTHRIVRGRSLADDVATQLQAQCVIRPLSHDTDPRAALASLTPAGRGCVAVLPGSRLMALARRPDAPPGPLVSFDPAVRGLDVTWADAYVVAALRNATDGADVGYSADAAEVIAEVRSGRAQAGVLLNPPAVEDVLAVADAGGFMPQKSTYFLPKVPSGLVMLSYDRA